MRSSRPRVLSIDEQERYSQYAEYQPYRPVPTKTGMHMDPLWLGIAILAGCALWAFGYVAFFQWR